MNVNRQLAQFGFANVVLLPKRAGGGSHLYTISHKAVRPEVDVQDRCELLRAYFAEKEQKRANAPLLTLHNAIGAAAKPQRSGQAAPVRTEMLRHLGVVVTTITPLEQAHLKDIAKHLAGIIALPELELIRPYEVAALDGPESGPSWGIRQMSIDTIWDKGLTGQGVTIGHLDTGIDGSHPALHGKVASFAEFDDQGNPVAVPTVRDTGTHGTHTAGLIVGSEFDKVAFGCAPGAKLASVIVIEGGNVALRVIKGLDWCIGQGVRVVNLSVGIRGEGSDFRIIMKIAREKNMLPVIAIGNDGPNSSRSPGNFPEALSVGAVDALGQPWPRSSYQQFRRAEDPVVPDIIAPGVSVWSSVPNNGLVSQSGTSMAAPHVAGLAALLLEKHPQASAYALERAIFASCFSPNADLALTSSRGVPNAPKALQGLDNM